MICSVILAGGAGTRLWPLSDTNIPKQFLKLFSDESMIVETSKRVSERVPMERQYVLTGEKYRALVEAEFGGRINILAEPQAKNTAPCILWAALKIARDCGREAVMVVMPSDHTIKKADAFQTALDTAVSQAERGGIATFGIVPTRAETGYGYIEIEAGGYTPNTQAKKLMAFHEKPDAERAVEYIKRGNYMWNSGMFIFQAGTIIDEFQKYCPEVFACFSEIDVDSESEVAEAFAATPSISIDYAIMEHTQNAVCVPSLFGWSDVGGYASLHEESGKDDENNVLRGDIITRDTTNCYIHGQKRIVCVGLEDIVVVESKDTILIAKKDMSEQIGQIAKELSMSAPKA